MAHQLRREPLLIPVLLALALVLYGAVLFLRRSDLQAYDFAPMPVFVLAIYRILQRRRA